MWTASPSWSIIFSTSIAPEPASLLEQKVNNEINELVECINHTDASFIIVTNEVGTGLVPANRVGRLYRDLLGKVNQLLARHADEVYLMVAGLPVQVKPAKPSI